MMSMDPRAFIDFVQSARFRVVMAVAGGIFFTFIGVAVSHRLTWIYPVIGVALGVGAAFVIQWVVRFILPRL